MVVILPRFTLADLERANDEWGCNCGPSALAAICGLTLDETRVHFGPKWPGYTNPTSMYAALRSIGMHWASIGVPYESRSTWPIWGLCRIQWEGPWTQPGVPMRARYRHTHWVGAATDRKRGIGIFDVNVLANRSGWCSLEDWATHVAPALAKGHRRATGAWYITHAIEAEMPRGLA